MATMLEGMIAIKLLQLQTIVCDLFSDREIAKLEAELAKIAADPDLLPTAGNITKAEADRFTGVTRSVVAIYRNTQQLRADTDARIKKQ